MPFEGAHLDYAKGEITLPFHPLCDSHDFDFTLICLEDVSPEISFLMMIKKSSLFVSSEMRRLLEMEAFAFASVAREF